jgi:hypothetical protein
MQTAKNNPVHPTYRSQNTNSSTSNIFIPPLTIPYSSVICCSNKLPPYNLKLIRGSALSQPKRSPFQKLPKHDGSPPGSGSLSRYEIVVTQPDGKLSTCFSCIGARVAFCSSALHYLLVLRHPSANKPHDISPKWDTNTW